MAPVQHMLGQPLGAAGVGRTGIQNGFHQREFGCAISQPCAADHVPNDKHVRLDGHLLCAKTFDEVNAKRTELVAHRWVDTCVAARYGMPRLARERGETSHEGSADAEYVYMHGRRF
ncbi:hypothetical protein D3C71_1446100 [compost metagenome]